MENNKENKPLYKFQVIIEENRIVPVGHTYEVLAHSFEDAKEYVYDNLGSDELKPIYSFQKQDSPTGTYIFKSIKCLDSNYNERYKKHNREDSGDTDEECHKRRREPRSNSDSLFGKL